MRICGALITTAVTAALLLPATSEADNTLRGNKLKPKREMLDPNYSNCPPTLATDTVRLPDKGMIELSGYDKPLRTSRETMLVTNLSDRGLHSMAITINYVDMQNRQLHTRTDTINADVPAGETRMVKVATWDTQHSYYYHAGQQPRTSYVTPYDVRVKVEFAVFRKPRY